MGVLIYGDTIHTPELRHEVPLGIPDPFTYAELDGRRVVAINTMEATRVEALGTDLEVHLLEEFGADDLRRGGIAAHLYPSELAVRIVKGLGIESATVPAGFPLQIADALRAAGVELAVDQLLFDDRRRAKSSHELAGIRSAQRATEAAMAEVQSLLERSEPGSRGRALDGELLTCELLKERVQAVLLRNGAFSDDPIVSHGAQTAVGHDSGSGTIASDDVVLVDLFPKDFESSCFADMTRTFAVGAAPDEIRDYHRLCKEALDLALAELRPGLGGGELHRTVSAFFSEHGFPTQLTKKAGEALVDGFYHALGHGVGLTVHEAPNLGMIGQELVSGDVVAIEPGLYRSGFGGVRLEDLVLVTDDGCEVLTDFPYDLEVRG